MFFRVILQLNSDVCNTLCVWWPDAELLSCPILQPGSWMGGDWDENPNMIADVMLRVTDSAAYTAVAHYLTELTHLEKELSMSVRLITVTPELSAIDADILDR